MRTIPAVLAMCLASIVLAPTVRLARLLGVRQGAGSIFEWCMRAWAKSVLIAAGVKVRVHGAEHLSAGAVYVSNHVSWFDIFSLETVVPRCTFISKRSLRSIPMFGPGAAATGIVFIDRGNRKAAFAQYEAAALSVRAGRSIVVCPEGTRGTDYHLRPFKKGPFVLAIAAQAPIVPTIVYGAREIMPKGSVLVRSGVVDIHFLPPVSTAGMTYEERTVLRNDVWARMADLLRTTYGVESLPE